MKKIALATSCLALLSGCATQETPDTWSIDCERNYSLNSRELAQCKEKVKQNETVRIQPGAVTLDSENARLVDTPGVDGKDGRRGSSSR